MRFLLFDRITDFTPGKIVEGIKTISLSDEVFRGHFDRKPVFPGTLVLESMVQITGWLEMERAQFAHSVVLSVAENVRVPTDLSPGTQLSLRGELLGSNPKGSMARATASINGEVVAEVGRILYAHVPHPNPAGLRELFVQFGGPA